MALNKKQRLVGVWLVVTYVLLVCWFSVRSAEDPGSHFFQPEKGYQPRYSLTRIEEALRFLATFNLSATVPAHNNKNGSAVSENIDMCAGIVTVKRPMQQNLDTTVGSILDGLSRDQWSSLELQVLFAQTNLTDHPDYGQPWVANLVDHVLTYDQLNASIDTLRHFEQEKNVQGKSLIDYRLSLEACYYKTDAKWFLMLEDDVVAQKKWYGQTMQSLRKAKEWQEKGKIHDWLYLRLFYTEKFLGWNSEEWPIYLAASLLTISAVGGMGLFARRKFRPMHEVISNRFLAVVCLVYMPLIIVLYFLAGRVTVRPMNPGVHVMNRNGCCSQAMLFPREKAPLLIDHLRKTGESNLMAVDSAIEVLADQTGLDRLAMSPSQMQHVGAASYKEKKKSWDWEGPHPVQGAHGVWSVGFESAYEA
ncbi:hypothetical protein NUU61_008201 [Penicillium alfredii]|uniref:Integral membrane protein n=1 Tax=Penicillium alfredii TaxID=1506179 RepID=A0A9W9JYT1_9EURO|nr:uncharacterized protein NUU61_008201 [Penicillium alfredii]KAJ5086894.1 hypothetical protein NUU61_008201 [Penicillium alfredii]